LAKPFQHDAVLVTWAKKLAEMIAEPGPLTTVDVTDIADSSNSAPPQQDRLVSALPPVPPKG
jgi:hypothetical protein